MSAFNKISVGVNNKSYTRDMSFDNNTTFDFGSIQPLFSQLLVKDAKVSLNSKQLVRLAPMPVPTFARMSLRNKYCFIPISDVYKPFLNLQSGIPYFPSGLNAKQDTQSYIPEVYPFISNRVLLALVLHSSEVTFYSTSDSGVTTGKFTLVSGLDNIKACLASVKTFLHSGSKSSSRIEIDLKQRHGKDVSVKPTGCDYLLEFYTELNGKNTRCFACFRFSQRSKRLRKIFLGLGYNLDYLNNDNVWILPILAFYKAYFDSYVSKRSLQFSTSYCYSLSLLIEQYGFTSFPALFDGTVDAADFVTNLSTVFSKFIFDELSNCFYVYDDDYISANRLSLSNNVDTKPMSFIGADGYRDTLSVASGTDDTALGYKAPLSKQPYLDTSEYSYLSLVGLQTIKRLSKYVNKDSALGRKISSWVKAHFGDEEKNLVFRDVFNVFENRVNIEVDDIYNSADTSVGNSQGEVLGAYGGKSLSFDKSDFKFTAPCEGFLICLSAIVPDSRYFQGCDPQLYITDKYTFPVQEFDALGYEVTPLGTVYGDNGLVTINASTSHQRTKVGFGFLPRFSGFKYKKDIINGDMSRRGTIDDMSPYYLDRIMANQNAVIDINTDGSYTITTTTVGDVRDPQVFREACRYPFLGNFNRIFYQSGSIHAGVTDDKEPLLDDNFIVQSVFDMKITDYLKPMSMSYDTFDEDNDTHTVDVKAQ